MIHTYEKKTNWNKHSVVWRVGYYYQTVYETPDGQAICPEDSFVALKDFEHEIQAAAYVNFLNGGPIDVTLIKELLGKAV